MTMQNFVRWYLLPQVFIVYTCFASLQAEKEKKKRGKERKRVKDRREKDRYDREEEESRDNGVDSDREILSETRASYKRKKSGEDRERKRHRHIHRTADYMDIAEAEHSEKNHRHNGDHKKATQVPRISSAS